MVRTVLGDDVLSWGGGGKAAHRLRVEYSLDRAEVGERGVLRASLMLRLDSGESFDDTALESSGVFEHAYAVGDGLSREAVREHLARTVNGVGKGLLLQATLLVSPAADLVRAMSSGDLHVRTAAVRIAGYRRERQAVPGLIELLRHSDERISDAAIGALVAIGDRRAVRPLCERFEMGDVRGLAKVVDAIASLGGGEARAYLELLGSGHDDPMIRAIARAALVRMSQPPKK